MSTPNTERAVAQLAGIVGPEHVVSSYAELERYAVGGLTPRLLVSPADAEEIGQVLVLAAREGLAVLPRGSGTKFSLGGRPRAADLFLSLERLNQIVDYDAPNLTLTVQAGARIGELRRVLTAGGNLFPLDAPFEEATIGGILATNASGPKRLLYGTARDMVLGVRAVLANGEAVRFGGKVVKNVAGYDMNKLLIGSWGTLGVLTEATFRLLPLPEAEASLLVSFPSRDKAAGAVSAVLASQLVPSAVDLFNYTAGAHIAAAAQLEAAPIGYGMAIALEGFTEAVAREANDLSALMIKQGAVEAVGIRGEAHARLWTHLRDFARIELGRDENAAGLKITVPPGCVGEALAIVESCTNAAGPQCAVTAHAGNGVLYPFLSGEPKQVVEAARQIQDRAGKLGSAIVEWGPWAIKDQLALWGEPRPDWAIMRRLKQEFDPGDMLNPGRFVGGI